MSFNQSQTILASLLLFLIFNTTAFALQSGGFEATVELREGSDFKAELKNVDRDTATFSMDGADKAISIETINRISFSGQSDEPSQIAHAITLADGSKLFCLSFSISDRELIAETEIPIRIKTRLIDHIQFPTVDTDFKTNWKKTTALDRESDALVVSRDSKLQMIDGIVGDVSAENVSFTVGERTADVKRSRLAGMLFYRRTTDEFAPSVFVLQLADGSTIEVQSLTIEDGQFAVRSVAGASFKVGPDSVARMDFSSNREMWLTDLDPATNDWSPLLASPNIIGSLKHFSLAKIDKSFNSKPLAILDRGEDESWVRKEFNKGFAIKGGGKLSFVLARQFQHLSGSIAFDPDANSTGVVKLIIQVDGANHVEEVLDAAKMKSAFPIDIDLNDADRIVFQVEYHDRRSVGDILHAVEMKLIR